MKLMINILYIRLLGLLQPVAMDMLPSFGHCSAAYPSTVDLLADSGSRRSSHPEIPILLFPLALSPGTGCGSGGPRGLRHPAPRPLGRLQRRCQGGSTYHRQHPPACGHPYQQVSEGSMDTDGLVTCQGLGLSLVLESG